MSSPQGDVITTISETQQRTETVNSKQKLTVPRRMLEEEVWLSGSELKTDNSSSDEEHNKDAQDARAKKGAKKKTKTISQSARTKKTLLRQHHQEETIRETIKTVQEVTRTTTTSTSSSTGLKSSLNLFDKLLTKCEDDSRNFMKVSCNKADDEKTQLQKIKQLEDRIARAEQEYLNARGETERLVTQMQTMLDNVATMAGSDWEFFTDITRKWIKCFSGNNSKTDFFKSAGDSPKDNDDDSQSIERNQLKKSKHMVTRNKDRNKKLIKIRKGTNYNIVLRNIKQCPKTRFSQDMKPPELNECEQNRLSSLLNCGGDIYTENENYMGYCLRPDEIEKISEISSKIQLARQQQLNSVGANANDENATSNTLERRNQILQDASSENRGYTLNLENIPYNSLTDSEKQKLYASSQTNLALSDSDDDYGSCEEVEFASTTNLEIPN